MEQALVLSNAGLWAFLVLQVVLLASFARSIAAFMQQVRTAPPAQPNRVLTVGAAAPAFQVVDQQGRRVEVGGARDGMTLLLFILHTCDVCKEILPTMQAVRERYPGLRVIVIASEEGEGEDALLPECVYFVRSNEIRQRYFVKYVPAMVVLDARQRVAASHRTTSLADFEKRLEMYEKTAG